MESRGDQVIQEDNIILSDVHVGIDVDVDTAPVDDVGKGSSSRDDDKKLETPIYVNNFQPEKQTTDIDEYVDMTGNSKANDEEDILETDYEVFLDEVEEDELSSEDPAKINDKDKEAHNKEAANIYMDVIQESDEDENSYIEFPASTVDNNKKPKPRFNLHTDGAEEDEDYFTELPAITVNKDALTFMPTKKNERVPSFPSTHMISQKGSGINPKSEVDLTHRRSSMTPLGMPRGSTSHRLFAKGNRSHSEAKLKALQKSSSYSTFDHTPHSLFVELDEIFIHDIDHFNDWKERARWIKFEENWEEEAARWGNPHVASLDFHSLLDLRKCLEQGAVILDCEKGSLDDIMDDVTNELIKINMLQAKNKSAVMEIVEHKQKKDENSGKSFSGNLAKLGRRLSLHPNTLHESNSSETAMRRSSLLPSFLSRSVSHPAQMDTHHHPKDSTDEHKFNGVRNRNKADIDPENGGIANAAFDDKSNMDGDNHHYFTRRQSFAPFRHEPAILKHIPDASETAALLVGTVEMLDKPVAAFVRLSQPQHIENLTQVPLPVRFIFVLLGSSEAYLNYYETGRALGTLMANEHFHDVAYGAIERKDVLKALSGFLNESMVLPPGKVDEDVLLPLINIIKNREEQNEKKEHENMELDSDEKEGDEEEEFDPLARTKKPFGGVWNNIKERYPLYWSDIKDALHPQCLGTFFYIYFACLAPAITFGGLMGTKTENWLGVSEMLVGTAFIGGVFSLVAGQPLLILGGTGPTLVFEESLFQISNSFDVDFLAFRFWVGVWVAIIAFVSMGAEAVALMKYVSRFTKDVFAVLISLIFIIETFLKIDAQFKKHPLVSDYSADDDTDSNTSSLLLENDTLNINDTTPSSDSSLPPQPNTALLSFILTMCTFLLAYELKQFQRSQYLGKTARKLIGDFSVPIAMAIMVIIDVALHETYTEKLDVPNGMVPSRASERGWFIDPTGQEKTFPVWTMFVAVIPAIVLYILLYLEILISSMIVNKKEQKLRKGTGYHLDMLYVSASAIVSGLIGTPFLSVATVRSVGHTKSLEVYSASVAPGEKPQLEFVREQRVTNFLAHVMLGVSTLLGVVLRYIPISVLFGVFLFMGVSSLVGLQLYDRIHLIFMPVKHHPDVPYVKNVRTWKMHLFTFIQLVCLGLLWGVKSTRAALAFPFILILMVPFRIFVLKYFFTPKELCYLDSEDSDIKTADNVNSKNSTKDNENEDKAKTNVHVAKSKANAQV